MATFPSEPSLLSMCSALVVPGENHGAARSGTYASYGLRKQSDFFVQHLLGVMPPDWNAPAARTTTTTSVGRSRQ